MSIVKPITGRDIELKFTFNSFKYMGDFNFKDFERLDDNPFKLATMLQSLIMGASNHNPRIKVSEDQVVAYLEKFSEDGGDLSDLLTEMMDLLQESSFFKSLQKTAPKTDEE